MNLILINLFNIFCWPFFLLLCCVGTWKCWRCRRNKNKIEHHPVVVNRDSETVVPYSAAAIPNWERQQRNANSSAQIMPSAAPPQVEVFTIAETAGGRNRSRLQEDLPPSYDSILTQIEFKYTRSVYYVWYSADHKNKQYKYVHFKQDLHCQFQFYFYIDFLFNIDWD